jgi:hypothetical protein
MYVPNQSHNSYVRMFIIQMHLLRYEGMMVEVGEVDNIPIILFINPFLFVIVLSYIMYGFLWNLRNSLSRWFVFYIHIQCLIFLTDDFVMSIVSLECPFLVAPSVFSNVRISKACSPIYHRFVLVLNVMANFKLIDTKNIFNVQFQLTHLSIH